MRSGVLYLFFLISLLSCGKNLLPKLPESKSSSSPINNTSQVNYNPAQPNYSPVILSFYYYDNGTSVEWEYPLGQVANYRVEFCSNSAYTNCSKVIQITCSDSNNCFKSSGQTGIITVGDGRSPGRLAILYSYQPTGQTYSIRVRAETLNAVSQWVTASGCTFSHPGQCYFP